MEAASDETTAGFSDVRDPGESGHQQSLAAPVETGDSMSSFPSIAYRTASAAGRAAEQADPDGVAVVVAPQVMTCAEVVSDVGAAVKEKEEIERACALVFALEADEAEKRKNIPSGVRDSMTEAEKVTAAPQDMLPEDANSASRSAVEEVAAVAAARSSQAEVATVDSRCFGKVYNMMTVLSTPNLLWNIS
jgi:hypothetical protein